MTERVEAPAYLVLELLVAAENHLLGLLDASTLALLKPHMRTISVEHGELLHTSSSEIEFAYFPRSCIVSAATRRTISVSMVNSLTVPTSGIITSGRASTPSFFTSHAAWKIARTCIS